MSEHNQFRPCGGCSACCEGYYAGVAYGNTFKNGKPCVFLVNKLCAIYDDRPGFCRKFQCAWSQHLLDESLRPDQCGLLVSVETHPDSGAQYLKAVEITPHVPYETLEKLNQAAIKLNTQWTLIKYHDIQS
jgi:Fe-S-cluster containining protein